MSRVALIRTDKLDDGLDGDCGVVAVDVGVVVGLEAGCQHDAFFAVGASHRHLTVEANYEEALDAYETTTDELDRAEARQALDDLGRSYNELLDEAQEALDEAVWQLHDARRAQGGQPEDIAYQRAWEALLAADPDLADLSAAVGVRSSGSTSIATPTTTAAPTNIYAFGSDDIIYA